ncbi:hypothetical protein CDU01_05615 [Cronobacter sakazakii]|nr:hypothetical protein [Cronobacter sakazakii]EGT5207634.1 hypothetical protein [Cronobacter sakazakii]EGT5650161.1 hypothetical protein [Cronobacter sakazakii]EGT5754209.1 hypothetical protein [Cronobacter sakazakii]PPY02489.1 hypothetical protein C3D66_07265 [Cronobacter sakazakii]
MARRVRCLDTAGALRLPALQNLRLLAGALRLPALQNSHLLAGALRLPALHIARFLTGRAGKQRAPAAVRTPQKPVTPINQYPIVFFFSNISLAVSGR